MRDQEQLMAELMDPNAGVLTETEKKAVIARLAARKKTGHAWLPGTGPAGETCKTCKHYYVKQMSKSYRKCGLMQEFWTGGPGTDIRASDPACKKWEGA